MWDAIFAAITAAFQSVGTVCHAANTAADSIHDLAKVGKVHSQKLLLEAELESEESIFDMRTKLDAKKKLLITQQP